MKRRWDKALGLFRDGLLCGLITPSVRSLDIKNPWR